jgi:adenylosuccinate synthase
MAELDDQTREDLERLFEMTTVTKKLRRIAALDYNDLKRAARQIRPDRVVVTFMNYLYPERWCTSGLPTEEERAFLVGIEDACGAPVTMINRGPRPEHFVGARWQSELPFGATRQ